MQTAVAEKKTQTSQYVAPHWFKLDNAATIYPASRTRTYACTYRIAFILKQDVQPEVLRKALRDVAPRFPSYFTQLRTGLFWNYLEQVDDPDVVEEESEYPCHRPVVLESDKPAFRVIYYKRRLGIETFHAIADGGASITFLKTLTAHYLELLGNEIPNNGEFLDITQQPQSYEHEDCFKKIYKKTKGSNKESISYQYKPKIIPNYFQAVHGIIPVADIKTVCKPLGITITEYLAAVLLYSVYLDNPKNKKPIKISVPISLRPIYGYETLRNFSLFTNIGFTPKPNGESTFEDIIESIKGKIKEATDPEALAVPISRNVSSASIPVVRFLPNVLKRPLLRACYLFIGQNKFLCSMTNLGVCKMPAEMKQHIDRMEVLLGGAPNEGLTCAITSIDDNLNFTFTGASKTVDVQRRFFTYLTSHGIRVRVESSNKEAWQ